MNKEELIQKAIEARELAYAPYSNFSVGAVVLTDSGKIYTGCNIENAAYPVTCCAERTAIFSAIANGEKNFTALAVVADTEKPVSPCGSCRQVMSEFFQASTPVTMANLKGETVTFSVSELLPLSFGLKQLPEDR
ncbi:cytidine deaminase [Aciduricibacillus chroicocephali]|uniref:Cytidine deaminase n=1 Tax=Aciduricibacillus chroicocephali TaxID=3054939 RepID=A0ABY9L2B4_9BACI|nr:cytidine deaminase [Bacillaceae bacterium 44XB]